MSDIDDFDLPDEFWQACDQVETTLGRISQTVSALPAQTTTCAVALNEKSDEYFDSFDDLDPDELVGLTATTEKNRQVASHAQTQNRQSQLHLFFESTAQPVVHNQVQSPQSSLASGSSGPSPMQSLGFGPVIAEPDVEGYVSTPPPPPSPAQTATCFHPVNPNALPTWEYPINYPLRIYQWNIVQKALFHNTLVALPTGLGKTFIAAVVMYNYWRWFPSAKVIFMAPTRPLVNQQIEACFRICGIPQADTVELTGSINVTRRKLLWMSKRVFYMTPQILQNDLRSKICPVEKIVCLVVDEAHKATGNYAYVEAVKKITRSNPHFRVLALTATPGTNIQKVQDVVTNLRISNVQIRTEDSMDIQAYSHGKNIQTIVVKLDYTAGATGLVPQTANEFRTKIFQPVLDRLSKFNVILSNDVERNSPFMLLTARKTFIANNKNFNPTVTGMIFVDFSIAESLSRAYEMLCYHGISSFLASLEQTLKDIQDVLDSGKNVARAKLALLNDPELRRIIQRARQAREAPNFIGHPKLERLLFTVLNHLSNAPPDMNTKIIVFSSYRSSVEEIVKLLSQHEPLVHCSSFIGQSDSKDGAKGLNQREQQEVIRRFKQNELNVLVATSIGEEGLDIGEVDLIICYDSQSSPIRMLQRMGRTGRKRKGECVLLMTEPEERKYRQAKISYNRVQSAIAKGGAVEYFKPDPVILPENYRPVCHKRKLAIGLFIKTPTSKRHKASSNDSLIDPDGTLTEEGVADLVDTYCALFGPQTCRGEDIVRRHWPTTKPLHNAIQYLPLNKHLTPYKRVGHSRRSVHFVDLVRKMERRVLHDDLSTPGEMESVTLDNELRTEVQINTSTLFLPRRPRRQILEDPEEEEDVGNHSKRLRIDDSELPSINDHIIDLESSDAAAAPLTLSPAQQSDLALDTADNFTMDNDDILRNLDPVDSKPNAASLLGVEDNSSDDFPPLPDEIFDLSFGNNLLDRTTTNHSSAKGGNTYMNTTEFYTDDTTPGPDAFPDTAHSANNSLSFDFGDSLFDSFPTTDFTNGDPAVSIEILKQAFPLIQERPRFSPIAKSRLRDIFLQFQKAGGHMNRAFHLPELIDQESNATESDQDDAVIFTHNPSADDSGEEFVWDFGGENSSLVLENKIYEDQDALQFADSTAFSQRRSQETENPVQNPNMTESSRQTLACQPSRSGDHEDANSVQQPRNDSIIHIESSPMNASQSDHIDSSPFRPHFRRLSARMSSFDDLMSQPVSAPACVRRARKRRAIQLDSDEEQDTPHQTAQQKQRKENQASSRNTTRPTRQEDNPFLDLEAERSMDDCSTGDDDDEHTAAGSALLSDSFIYDGSSDLAPVSEEGRGLLDGPSSRSVDIYRASLLSPDERQPGRRLPTFQSRSKRKNWIDKLPLAEWEQLAEDPDTINDDDDDDNNEDNNVHGEPSIIYSAISESDLS